MTIEISDEHLHFAGGFAMAAFIFGTICFIGITEANWDRDEKIAAYRQGKFNTEMELQACREKEASR